MSTPWRPRFSLTTFAPGEVEAITGLSTGMQRDWRARGLLPQPANDRDDVAGGRKKHPRFTPLEVAEMWTMKLLAQRGIGPQASAGVAKKCAVPLFMSALFYEQAYEGDHARTFDWLDPSEHPGPHHEELKKQLVERRRKAGDSPERLEWLQSRNFGLWDDQREWLLAHISEQLGLPVVRSHIMTWWPSGDVTFGGAEIFEQAHEADERFEGVLLQLELGVLGEILLKRAGRPLIKVAFDRATDHAAPVRQGDRE